MLGYKERVTVEKCWGLFFKRGKERGFPFPKNPGGSWSGHVTFTHITSVLTLHTCDWKEPG